ncbi:alpha-1,2-mannosidase, putative [Pedobacter sp. BAL39]|nr:alpha-1,2-mannosidase, putative [Pedobacter sp. BAL39]
MLGVSCKDIGLEDFSPEKSRSVQISAAPLTSEIFKTQTQVNLDLEVLLSDAADNAFEIDIAANQDTISTLIENGTLENTVMLAPGTYEFPNVLKVAYGVRKHAFKAAVNINAMERNFGKKVAFALTLNRPSKGNTIVATKETFVVVLDTREILSLEDIHYISFQSGTNGVYQVPSAKNYNVTSGGIVIPVTLQLNGTGEGPAFSSRLKLNIDTISELVSNGTLAGNTFPLTRGTYSIDTVVRFAGNTKTAKFNITVPMNTINDNLGKALAVSLRLTDATRNLIDPVNNNLIVVVNTINLAERDITSMATLSVTKDNSGGPNAGEGSSRLVDNNVNTKFLFSGWEAFSVNMRFPSPMTVKAYTLTSGNDAKDRDPKSWKLKGSNDGINYVTLDERTDEQFPTRTLTKRYEFDNTETYLYYQLEITDNDGSSDFQLSEFRLIQLP